MEISAETTQLYEELETIDDLNSWEIIALALLEIAKSLEKIASKGIKTQEAD